MPFKFEELKVWKDSVSFASEIYAITKKFPKDEQYGIIPQLNRAAVSISLNIAEGIGRHSDVELKRFIHIAIGSLNEVVTILHISLDQKYIAEAHFNLLYKKCESLSKMLHSFRNFLKNNA